jgi:hypothetical protein
MELLCLAFAEAGCQDPQVLTHLGNRGVCVEGVPQPLVPRLEWVVYLDCLGGELLIFPRKPLVLF